MKRRRLTVSSTSSESRQTRFPRPQLAPIPFLRLRGRWLDQAGFAIGKPVHVRVCAGLLVLEVIDEKESRHDERD